MGGRGGSSSMSNEKPVSKLMAKVYFNAKKSDALRSDETVKKDSKLEKVIKSENTDYFMSIKTKEEAVGIRNYVTDRMAENERKLARLGSADAVFRNQKIAIEHRKLVDAELAIRDKMKEFSKAPEKGNTNIHDTSRTTTTYDRARKRRMKKFDSWFFGSGK